MQCHANDKICSGFIKNNKLRHSSLDKGGEAETRVSATRRLKLTSLLENYAALNIVDLMIFRERNTGKKKGLNWVSRLDASRPEEGIVHVKPMSPRRTKTGDEYLMYHFPRDSERPFSVACNLLMSWMLGVHNLLGSLGRICIP